MGILKNVIAQINLSSINIPNIGINSVVDMLIVALILYNILMWVKETRAWSLLKGLAIILFVSTMAHVFNLYTLTWIINNTLNVGIIAIIVLFTPELRKALEQIGSNNRMNSFFNSNVENKQITDSSLDDVISACIEMAKVCTGAIIVIENNIAIGDIANTGISVDANITKQLLVNIFEHNTPLHDGAVVIRENRISAACCILPLTDREIGKELGTRHRAAVGVSEISDAFIFVVSEETGHMSLAHSGKLIKNVTIKQIKETVVFTNNEKVKKLPFWKGGKNINEKS